MLENEPLVQGYAVPNFKRQKVPSLSNPIVILETYIQCIRRGVIIQLKGSTQCHLVVVVEFRIHNLTTQDIMRRTCLIPDELVE